MSREVFAANRSAVDEQVNQILRFKPSSKVRRLASVVKVFHQETGRPLAEVLHTQFGIVVVTFRAEDTAPLAKEPLTDNPLQEFRVASSGGLRFPALTAALLCAYITDGIKSLDLPWAFPYSHSFGYQENWSEEAKRYLRIANHSHIASSLHAEGKPELAAIFDVQDDLKRLNAIRDTPQKPAD